MERTGEMGERMFEIKRKQSSGRWMDRQYETAAERWEGRQSQVVEREGGDSKELQKDERSE